jgi:hypothetical protein
MLATLVVVPAVGCNMWEAEPPDEVSGTGSAQLALSTEVRRDTDVARVRTTIESCDGKEHQSIEAALHEMRLPGGFEETGVPLDEQSTHRFADAFIVLAAGCYNVESMPLNAHGAPSTQCFPAHAKEIEVVDGKTTEVWLVSQCDGADVGALDTTTVTNHPPTLKSVSYNPSKFIAAGSSVILSVTAEDPDGDPLEFEWTQVGGPDCDLSVLRLDDDDGNERTEQVKITANMSGRYEFKVSIYDLLRDDKGELIRFETYLEQQGDPHASNDSLVLPLYVANE